ncbi:MAG: hypothetical protein HYY34_06310 [Chloroflexi bacterium]|nr:hypothetical protein [Chloroflexota bacterium]
MLIRSRVSRLTALLLLAGGLLSTVAIACGGEEPTAVARPAATATTAPVVQPTATTAAATAAPAPVATATTRATATAAPQATNTPAPTVSAQSGEVVFAIPQIFPIAGQTWLAPYSATRPIGITDPMYTYDPKTGDPMSSEGAVMDSWKVSADGLTLTMTVRPNIPWNAPKGREFIQPQLGNVTAQDIADFLNTCNATTQPDTTCGDAGDFAAYGFEAKVIDAKTIEQKLTSPTYFCTPYSEFGCLSAAQHPSLTLRSIKIQGRTLAQAYGIGSGPFVSGECIEGNRCESYAIPKHWYKTAEVGKITLVQAPEAQTRIAMLQAGQADMASADFKNVPAIMADFNSGKGKIRFLQLQVGDLIGQSIIYSGNLWELKNARTGDDLNPWNSPVYAKDYAWIGDIWQELQPDKVKYKDTDNPPGMTDMEQARLVRLAMGTAIDRKSINKNILGDLGDVLYSEYAGPGYPGWDPKRNSGVWDYKGDKIAATGTQQPVAWELKDGDVATANQLLDTAGYKKDSSGKRPISDFNLNVYSAEAGDVGFTVADNVVSVWNGLGVKVEQRLEAYGAVISPRMRLREQFWPVIKNGDVNSNVWPLNWPNPVVDSSLSRPGWGVGFETPYTAAAALKLKAERDQAKAAEQHLAVMDYMVYWQLYNGLFQVPRGVLVGPKIKSWNNRYEHYGGSDGSNHPEYIVLNK